MQSLLSQELQHVLLSGLTEGQPVERDVLLDLIVSRFVAAQEEWGDV